MDMTPLLLLLAGVAGIVAVATACGVNMVFTVRASLDFAPAHRVFLPYIAGSLLGSVVVGFLLAAVGFPFHDGAGLSAIWPEWTVALLLLAATVLGLRELELIRVRLPQRASQLNSDGLALGMSRRLFSFGAWLGTGFLTYSPYGGLHLLAIAAVIAPSYEVGMLLFIVFGLSRGITVALLAALPRSWEDAAQLSDRLAAAYRRAQLLTAASLGAIAIGAASSLVR